jgi:hypothetical protein
MPMQKFYASPRDSFTWRNGAIGHRPGPVGGFDCVGPFARVLNCPVDGTALRLACYATGYADTFFSVPACTKTRGQYVAGYFSIHDESGLTSNDADPSHGVYFHTMDRHAARMPTAKRGQLLKLGARYLQHRRFALLLDSQALADVCESDDMGIRAADVSGILAHVSDGGYVEVWSTGYRRPHELESVYECVLAGTLADVRKYEKEHA